MQDVRLITGQVPFAEGPAASGPVPHPQGSEGGSCRIPPFGGKLHGTNPNHQTRILDRRSRSGMLHERPPAVHRHVEFCR